MTDATSSARSYPRPGVRARVVHPGAWWVWAICLAVATSTTTNPVVLVLVDAVLLVTALARRPYAPWAQNLRLYFTLAGFIVVSRVVLHVLVGYKTNDAVVLHLPTVHLPAWAAGIMILGPVGLGGLVGAALEGLRLATMLMCFGAANSLANPRRLLAATPAAVRDIGTASAIALSVSPQLVESVQRVRAAQALRGQGRHHRMRRVALPVLHDTLEGSLSLAASMEARGYGRRAALTRRQRTVAGAISLAGAFLTCLGVYGTMQGRGVGGVVLGAPAWTTLPTLVVGLVLAVLGLWATGRMMERTRYRRDPWGLLEWGVVTCALVTLVGIRAVFSQDPLSVSTPTEPLAFPHLPLILPLLILPALAPAFFTPAPVRPHRAASRVCAGEASAAVDVHALRGALR